MNKRERSTNLRYWCYRERNSYFACAAFATFNAAIQYAAQSACFIIDTIDDDNWVWVN